MENCPHCGQTLSEAVQSKIDEDAARQSEAFQDALANARKFLDKLGTGELRPENRHIVREGPRTYWK